MYTFRWVYMALANPFQIEDTPSRNLTLLLDWAMQ